MIKNKAFGKYVSSDSVIHRLDPRIKLIFSFLFLVLIFYVKSYVAGALCFAFVLLTAAMSSISIKTYLKSNKSIIFISLFTAGINFLFEAESKILTSGISSVNFETLKSSAIIFVRLVSLVLINSAVMFTTSPGSISRAIKSFLKPLEKIGFNTEEIAMTITVSLGFIPALFEETDKIIRAQKSRGANFKNKNIFKKIKAFSKIIIPLFVSSFKRASNLATAMDARCYNCNKKRTEFKSHRIQKHDILSAFVVLVIFLGVIACNFIMI